MYKKTKEAFFWLMKILRKEKVPYQISGGFAARIYGSKRPLADIDIEIHDKDFKKIMPYIDSKYILKGPRNYKDNQFDIYGLFLKYKGQKIDVCGADTEKLFDKRKGKWHKEKVDLNKTITKKVYGMSVKIVPLKNLIGYKKILLRQVDKIDIKNLSRLS